MTSFTQLLAGSEPGADGTISYQVPASWMQGRALYGGLSAALCIDGSQKSFQDLPPLRTMNVNFIGPGSAEVEVRATLLRRGKSVAWIRADLLGDGGLIASTTLGFGASRESRLDCDYSEELYGSRQEFPRPHDSENFYLGPEDFASAEQYELAMMMIPGFASNFEVRLVSGGRPASGSERPSMELWVKHKDQAAEGIAALAGIADMPPPAIMPVMKQPAPLSSLSWMFNILSDDLSSEDGWWLLGTYAEHARQGYSSQNMTIHNSRGELVLLGRQNVTVFY